MERFDVIIIGAGIAGASLAMPLAESGYGVLMLEAEAQPGFHATGRSAAFFAPGYGNAVVRTLTAESGRFFRVPPDGFTETPLLRRRAAMFIARPDQAGSLQRMEAELGDTARRLDVTETIEQVPILRDDYIATALLDENGGDIDVDALLQGFLRAARRSGCLLRCGGRATAMHHKDGLWHMATAEFDCAAPLVVNAAGAWADSLAALAGLKPLGLAPMRRTALTVAAGQDWNMASWPMAIDVDELFYFKPEAGALLLSPADETISEPCDAQAEEIDVAYAVERVERATTLRVRRVLHRWAGLRTFAPDRTPVVGFDPRAQGFFWLAGQGGYGVQTAPALGALAAALIIRQEAVSGEITAALSPARFLG
ncbi:MAG: FAD-binding oxidoreductase [Rhizomicrobium sp.]